MSGQSVSGCGVAGAFAVSKMLPVSAHFNCVKKPKNTQPELTEKNKTKFKDKVNKCKVEIFS